MTTSIRPAGPRLAALLAPVLLQARVTESTRQVAIFDLARVHVLGRSQGGMPTPRTATCPVAAAPARG